MLRKLRPFSLLCALCLAATTATRAQNTIHVPADQPTIQAGVDAANNGDTVLVSAGTYLENVVISGKNITLTGVTPAPGQAPPTILDGSSQGPALSIGPGPASPGYASVVSNFTIQHGGNFSSASPSATATGGIEVNNSCGFCSGPPPSILNNLIINNNCWGVHANGSPYIAFNTISSTQDPTGDCGFAGGAGILISGDQYIAGYGEYIPATIYANIIENNVQNGFEATGSSGGAGIAVDGGLPLIASNIIHDNASPGGTGAGINIFQSEVRSGLGIAILQNLIYDNRAGCGGGAIATPTSRNDGQINLLIANNTLVNNTGDDTAGYEECAAVSQLYPAPESAADNDAGFLSGPDTIIVNNIITGSATDPAVNCTPFLAPSEAIQPLFDHNILHNAGGAFFGSFCFDESTEFHNLTADPRLDTDLANLYHPLSGSPAIDAGNNSALAYVQQVSGTSLSRDAAGSNRVQDATGRGYPVIDIGAYEYPATSGGATEPSPNTLVLTSSPYAGPANSDFTLTAVVGASTGSITFYSDGQALGSATISSGVAKSTFTLGPGVHGVYATYDGAAGSIAPAISVPVIIDVAKVSTSLLLQSDAIAPPLEPSDDSVVGQSVKFTITAVADDNSIPSPISLTNLDTNTVLASALLLDSSGSATFTTSFGAPGNFRIQAAYAGDTTHAAASDTIRQHVTGYPTTTTVTCPTSIIPFGGTATLTATVTSTNGTPNGLIHFSDQGVDLGDPVLANGSASITYNAANSGERTIIANYPATGAFASSYATCNLDVAPQNTLALTSSSPLIDDVPSSPAYTPITFTAALTTTTGLTGTYSITIRNSSATITSAMSPDAAGTTATYTTSALAPGQYDVSAVFNPNNKSPSLTATLHPYQLVTAPTGDFTITGPSSITTRTESSATGTLTLASIDNFQGTVTLSCILLLPTTYTCAVSPTSVPLAVGGTGSATVTLSPTLKRAANPSASRIVFASLFPLALISLAGFRRRRKLSAILSLAILAMLAASTTACGNDIYYPATPPGTYPFTITATGTPQGATVPITHTLNIPLVLTR